MSSFTVWGACVAVVLFVFLALGTQGCLKPTDQAKVTEAVKSIEDALVAHKEGTLTTAEAEAIIKDAKAVIDDIRGNETPWWEILGGIAVSIGTVVIGRLVGVPGLRSATGKTLLNPSGKRR